MSLLHAGASGLGLGCWGRGAPANASLPALPPDLPPVSSSLFSVTWMNFVISQKNFPILLLCRGPCVFVRIRPSTLLCV